MTNYSLPYWWDEHRDALAKIKAPQLFLGLAIE